MTKDTPLTRADIERLRDEADYAHLLYQDLIRDLATTALAYDDEANAYKAAHTAAEARIRELTAENERIRAVKLVAMDDMGTHDTEACDARITDLEAALRAEGGESRLRALEEGLRAFLDHAPVNESGIDGAYFVHLERLRALLSERSASDPNAKCAHGYGRTFAECEWCRRGADAVERIR